MLDSYDLDFNDTDDVDIDGDDTSHDLNELNDTESESVIDTESELVSNEIPALDISETNEEIDQEHDLSNEVFSDLEDVKTDEDSDYTIESDADDFSDLFDTESGEVTDIETEPLSTDFTDLEDMEKGIDTDIKYESSSQDFSDLEDAETSDDSDNTIETSAEDFSDLVDVEGIAKNIESPFWGEWEDYEKVVVDGKTYAKVGERLYTKHAVDRMAPSGNHFRQKGNGSPEIIRVQEANELLGLDGKDNKDRTGRGVAPTFAEDVINNGTMVNQSDGTYLHELGSVKVVTDSDGNLITIET